MTQEEDKANCLARGLEPLQLEPCSKSSPQVPCYIMCICYSCRPDVVNVETDQRSSYCALEGNEPDGSSLVSRIAFPAATGWPRVHLQIARLRAQLAALVAASQAHVSGQDAQAAHHRAALALLHTRLATSQAQITACRRAATPTMGARPPARTHASEHCQTCHKLSIGRISAVV